MTDKKCPVCSEQITGRVPSEIKKKTYCSNRCRWIIKRKYPSINCLNCKKNMSGARKRKYCSMTCKLEYMRSRPLTCKIHGALKKHDIHLTPRENNKIHRRCNFCIKENNKKNIKTLTNAYLKTQILNKGNLRKYKITVNDVPQSLVELERARLQLKRAIRESKK